VDAASDGLCAFLQGSCGDLRPHLIDGSGQFRDGTFGDAWSLGQSVAGGIQTAARTAQPVEVSSLKAVTAVVEVDTEPRAVRQEGGHSPFPLRHSPRVPVPVGVLQLGPDILAYVGAEVLSDTAETLINGSSNVLLVGYTNGNVGYLPSVERLREGGYEAEEAFQFYGYPGPYDRKAEATVVSAIQEFIKELNAQEMCDPDAEAP
jgi:hypothetical protein